MPTVIPVKFRYASRDLWFDPRDTEALEGDHVICETERGQEIGLATEDPCEVSYNEFKRRCGDAILRPVLRLATEEDLERAEELAQMGDDAMPVFRELAKEEGLDMKPVGVEYLFDSDKVVCYFSADERVDFRQLVRGLSRELHQRIDMRQIGVREEAALVGGYGHCGQELCCARFGHQFEPVSIRMAKEQDLPLNSTKISGACGRLMCCLRYEFEAYRDFKQRAPKRNAVIDTPLGKAKIVEYDTPKEELALRIENGKVVRVKLAEMETSEAAVKKSEELHCPCRPDTVTRAALDKINSPDVQMALAELDRENGLLEEETFDESDIFVSPKPRRRRRQSDAEDGSSSSAGKAGASSKGSGEQTSSRKRRRRKGQGQGQSQGQAKSASGEQAGGKSKAKHARESGQQQAGQQQGKRRTRQSAPADAAATAASMTSHRKRRHHSANAEGAQQAQSQQGANAPSARRRRRPGDRGGAPDQQQASTQQRNQKPQQGKSGDDQAKHRSRRRRHRRPGDGGGASSGNDGSSGGAGPSGDAS